MRHPLFAQDLTFTTTLYKHAKRLTMRKKNGREQIARTRLRYDYGSRRYAFST